MLSWQPNQSCNCQHQINRTWKTCSPFWKRNPTQRAGISLHSLLTGRFVKMWNQTYHAFTFCDPTKSQWALEVGGKTILVRATRAMTTKKYSRVTDTKVAVKDFKIWSSSTDVRVPNIDSFWWSSWLARCLNAWWTILTTKYTLQQ